MGTPSILEKRLRLASRIMIIIVYMALIRSIIEPLRLNYYPMGLTPFSAVKPFIIAALNCACALLLMTIFQWYKQHLLTIVTGILAIVMMFVIKAIWL